MHHDIAGKSMNHCFQGRKFDAWKGFEDDVFNKDLMV